MTTLFVGITVAIASAVLGAVFGTLGGIFIERRRSRNEGTIRHFADVKTQVLEPLIQRIESYCIPVCVGQKHPVELISERKAEPIGEYRQRGREYLHKFVPLRQTGYSGLSGDIENRDPSVGQLNRVLYEHAKGSHYASILKEYEQLEMRLCEFQTSCANHSQNVIDHLSQTLDIPVVQGFGTGGEGVFQELGLFVLGRQLGTSQATIYRDEREPTQWYEAQIVEANRTYLFASKDKVDRALNVISDMLKGSIHTEELRNLAATLAVDFHTIATKLREASAHVRLPGKCSYV